MKALTTLGLVRSLTLAALLGLGVAGLSGCDDGPAEQAGEEIDEALEGDGPAERAGEEIDDAADEVGDAVEEAEEAIEDN